MAKKEQKRVTLSADARVDENGMFYAIMISEGEGHGYYFGKDALQSAVDVLEGLECFVDHHIWGKSVRDLGGVFYDVAWDDEENGIGAKLKTQGPSGPIVAEMGAQMVEEGEEPKPDVGFSLDILFTAGADDRVKTILKAYSCDLVFDPERGGKFVSQLQSSQARFGKIQVSEEVQMTKEIEIKPEERSELREQLEADRAAIREVMNVQAEQRILQEEAEAVRGVRSEMCAMLLESALAASKLPEAAIEDIRKRFSGVVFEAHELNEAIARQSQLVAEITGGQVIEGIPGGVAGVHQMFSSEDQLQAAVDDLLGAPREKGMQGVDAARLTGIKELYMMLTGDRGLRGGYHPSRIQLATTADFTGLVKNALNKIVVNKWAELGRAGYDWWESVVTVEHFETLNTITGTLVGTVGDLPEVAERGEYTELEIGDSPETADFTKYGGYVPLTLELIDRDETRKLRQYPRELASAGIRKISKLVAAIFTANSGVGPTMADTGALFNATAVTTAGGHANLLTTALAAAQWDVVAAAVYNQPMLIKNATGITGTGPKMAIEPRFCLVPRALKKAAFDAFVNSWVTEDNKHAENLLKGMVVPLIVPEWTDATDWAAVCDPAIAPAIFVGERFGIMPEIFIAGNERDPAVFMNDEHRIKVRHFLACWVNDFRPLHKSNVA